MARQLSSDPTNNLRPDTSEVPLGDEAEVVDGDYYDEDDYEDDD